MISCLAGTGQFAVQLAKLAGNHVIATCGNDEKAKLLKSLGADHVVNYKREDLGQVLRKEYPEGVDLVYVVCPFYSPSLSSPHSL